MKLKINKQERRMKWFLCLIFGSACITYGQTEKKYIRDGNGKYKDSKYAESEVSYIKAIDKNKMSSDAEFNLGDALYKQKKYEDAGKQFLDNSNVLTDNRKKSNSLYNLGNSLLNNNKVEESISAYKNSLKLDPNNPEAKYNLAYAQDLLKQQQQQQKGQNKDNKKDDQNKDQNQNQDKNQNNNKDQNQGQDKQQQQQQQQQPQQQGISKEDAQRLLDAIANDEKNVQEKVKLAKANKAKVRTLINW
jgi:Ca-activated chloride channel homolog